MSERASEGMSAAERASEASSAELANERTLEPFLFLLETKPTKMKVVYIGYQLHNIIYYVPRGKLIDANSARTLRKRPK